METAALNSRGSNPPSLYDTSTSTNESWSLSSTGRRTPQKSASGGYHPNSFLKTRLQASQTNLSSPSLRHASPIHRHSSSPRQTPTDHQQEYFIERTQSEPGISSDGDPFSSYENGFSFMKHQQRQQHAQSEIASEPVRRFKERKLRKEAAALSSRQERRKAPSSLSQLEVRPSRSTSESISSAQFTSPSRSLSPGRRSNEIAFENSKFKSKFYEAALAARRRGLQKDIQVHDTRGRNSSVDRRGRDFSRDLSSGRGLSKERGSRSFSQEPRSRAPHSRREDDPKEISNLTRAAAYRKGKDKGPMASPKQHKLNETAMEKENVSELVAKLNSVNRENPTEALAAIDSILRQESRSLSGEQEQPVRGTTQAKRESPTIEYISDDSSDETSVSSITNPFTPESRNETVASAFSPSTSSFRRPRPSALQSYTSVKNPETPTTSTEGTMSRSQKKRQQLKAFPPPTTIKIKGSKDELKASKIPKIPPPPKVASRRSHPWDDEVPVRQEGTTPVNNAASLKVVMKHGEKIGGARSFDSAEAAPINFSRSNSTPAASNDFLDDSFEESTNFFTAVQSSGLEVVQRKKALKKRYENAQKISDEFDAAWASMPALSLYSKQEETVSSPNNTPKPLEPGPNDLDDSCNTSSYDTSSYDTSSMSHAVTHDKLTLPSRANDDIFNRPYEQGEIEVMLDATPGSVGTEGRIEHKKRGFLRAFLSKKDKKKPPYGTSVQSASQASVGIQSLPTATTPFSQFHPTPPNLATKEMAPSRGRRSTHTHNSRNRIQRTRSDSLERFRIVRYGT